MIKKIISGGQTGADQAALDVAIKFHISHGGWVPKGRKTEDGMLPFKYQMDEMETGDYKERTHKNILDSHGTLIISYGELTGGSKLTQSYAKVVGRPNCYIDLEKMEAYETAIMVRSFLLENQIQVLNVAGPRLSNFSSIYMDVKIILESILYLLFLESHPDSFLKEYVPSEPIQESFPISVDDAVILLQNDLSLKTKSFMAKFKSQDVHMLYFVMLDYIRHRLGFDTQNTKLLKQCRKLLEDETGTIEDAVMVILKQLKTQLEADHLLRVVT